MNQISTRPPELFDKDSGQLMVHARSADGAPLGKPEIYVRQPGVTIQPADKGNDTGSLFNPDDERNYLFTSTGPVNVGRFITIKVNSNRKDGASGAKPGQPNAQSTATGDEVVDTMLKALPELAPADKADPVLIKQFKARVSHRFDNGDALVTYTRQSTREDQGNEVSVTARIPYDRLSSGEDLTTSDLADVHFVESSEGELVDRHSSGWEDEYALRMSGFSEAKSQMAMELEDKRRQLASSRENLETKIKSFGEERRQVAKQREDLNKKSVESQAKVSQLESTVADQNDTIEGQKQEIEKLTPQEKPGDEKEGGNG